jgi:hypothetical protein
MILNNLPGRREANEFVIEKLFELFKALINLMKFPKINLIERF